VKVLGILGSPRRGGNSEILLEEALRGARSKGAVTEKIYLGDLRFAGCIECGGCEKTGVCVLKDDMTPIYAKLKKSDAVVLASPIFFAGITAQLKAMIDRCQSEWVAKYILAGDRSVEKTVTGPDLAPKRKRLGAFICVGGHKKDVFFQTAKKTVEVFFKTMDIDFSDEIFFGGVDKPGEIKKVKGALKEAFALGQRIVEKR
jgi:multimeric flavodoxin WrbA